MSLRQSASPEFTKQSWYNRFPLQEYSGYNEACLEFVRTTDCVNTMAHEYKIRADFNGLFGDILCLSHEEACFDESGTVLLREGLMITAYEDDPDIDGTPDVLIANGKVAHAPDWLQCLGSKWVLMIDKNGVYHQSERTTESE